MRACSRPEPLPFETAAADGEAGATTPVGAAAFESKMAEGGALVAACSVRLPPAN